MIETCFFSKLQPFQSALKKTENILVSLDLLFVGKHVFLRSIASLASQIFSGSFMKTMGVLKMAGTPRQGLPSPKRHPSSTS